MASQISGVESAEWLNSLIGQMWPYIDVATANAVKAVVEPMFKETLPGPLKSLHFAKISLGETPMRVQHVNVHSRAADTIKLDMDLNYDGDCDIALKAPLIGSFGVQKVKLEGRISFLLRPLVPVLPLIAVVQVAFVSRPRISLDFTGAAKIADLALIDNTIRQCISDSLASMIVLPNRYTIKMDPAADFFKAYYEQLGVLRFTIKSGTGFKPSGRIVKDHPDVYCIAKFGAELEFRTDTQNDTQIPEWNSVRDFLLSDVRQEIELFAWDDDFGGDDFLGSARVAVKDLLKSSSGLDLPLTGEDGRNVGATVTVAGKLLKLVTDKASLEVENEHDDAYVGLLTIIIASAKNLKTSTGKSTLVMVKYGDFEQESPAVQAMEGTPAIAPENPYWDKAFEIPLTKKRLANRSLSISVLAGEETLGLVEVEIASILAAEGYEVAGNFDIGEGSTLRTKIILRGLAEAQ